MVAPTFELTRKAQLTLLLMMGARTRAVVAVGHHIWKIQHVREFCSNDIHVQSLQPYSPGIPSTQDSHRVV